MGAGAEINSYGSEHTRTNIVDSPFIKEASGQISLWNELRVVDPAILELSPEANPADEAAFDGTTIIL